MKKPSLYLTAIAGLLAFGSTATAHARAAYDGSWDLVFVTQRGACDPSYNFRVNISDGIVTHPNLVRFRGQVARSGAVRASVTVTDKYASGSGRLSGTAGRGTWSGSLRKRALRGLLDRPPQLASRRRHLLSLRVREIECTEHNRCPESRTKARPARPERVVTGAARNSSTACELVHSSNR